MPSAVRSDIKTITQSKSILIYSPGHPFHQRQNKSCDIDVAFTGLSSLGVPDFGRLVNPISTKGGRLCPPNNTGTSRFSDLPTATSRVKQAEIEKIERKESAIHDWFARNQSLYLKAELKKKKKAMLSDNISDDDLDECDICNNFTICANCI